MSQNHVCLWNIAEGKIVIAGPFLTSHNDEGICSTAGMSILPAIHLFTPLYSPRVNTNEERRETILSSPALLAATVSRAILPPGKWHQSSPSAQ